MSPPEFVKKALNIEMVLTSTHLNIARINRVVTSAWVDFGEPAMDCSGDGPYIAGEASIDHLGYIKWYLTR